MFQALRNQAGKRSERTSRRSSVSATPLPISDVDDSSSLYSEDSEGNRRHRKRRGAVTRRRPVIAGASESLTKKRDTKKDDILKSRRGRLDAREAKKVDKKETQKKESPLASPDEIVKIAKKEGTTKFQQMRKFLAKANEREDPPDILAEFFATRREKSPTRSSVGSTGSIEWEDFHTGLTPKSASRRWQSPKIAPRDSEESFAASDLLASEGNSVERRLGAFLHGQRSLNLRSKSKAVGAGDNIHLTALLVDDIPDLEEKIHTVSKAELRKRIIENTAEDHEDKENVSSLDDSQIAAELEMLTGL